jgi:RNA polymerase sigma-70 factor (ECF subfamily)
MVAFGQKRAQESLRSPRPELDRPTLARCVAGDAAAFQAFVLHYQVAVFALLSRLLGRGPQVEDLAQETFLRAFRALPDFDLSRETRPSTWLLTIGARLALDVRRRSAVAQTHHLRWEHALSRSEVPSPERDSVRAELRTAIVRAASELPDEQRDAFVLSEFHDFSLVEIAQALGVHENTVKTRLFRARQKLASALLPYKEEW